MQLLLSSHAKSNHPKIVKINYVEISGFIKVLDNVELD